MYHFIGIGGIGMSGLASLLLARGIKVSGSDIASSYVTEGLIKQGAVIHIGHSAQFVSKGASVVVSTDIKHDNSELVAAQQLKCSILHRSDLLKLLMEGYKTIAIAGTHGKTTTSSLMAHTLMESNIDPSFAVGGIIQKYQTNAKNGQGEYFVAEADESDGTFLKYDPFGAIVTNIDLDHLNYFGSEKALIDSFQQFIQKVSSRKHLLWCYEDERLRQLSPKGLSYGFHQQCDLYVKNYEQDGWKIFFDVQFQGKNYSKIETALIGCHNVLNAAAVFGLSLLLGADEKAVRHGLATFPGVKRRCEKKGEPRQILLLDDYAHHPTEIKTTLAGIRKAIGNRRLIAVFQPHRYSRTKDCLGTYGDALFGSADLLYITDIFAAGEMPIEGLSHENVMKEIDFPLPQYIPRKSLLKELIPQLKTDDVVVTLGAGDITKLGAEINEQLK